MANEILNQFRQADPSLADLSDDALVQEVSRYLPEGTDTEAFYKDIGYTPPGLLETFGTGFNRAIESGINTATTAAPAMLLAGAAKLTDTVGKAVGVDTKPLNNFLGVDDTIVKLLDSYENTERQILENNPTLAKSFTESEDLYDYAMAAANAGGEGLGSIVNIGIGALAGGVTGGAYATVRGGISKTIKQATKKKLGQEITDEQAEAALSSTFMQKMARGATVGSFAAPMAIEGGQSYVSLLSQGANAPEAALAVGAISGALERFVPALTTASLFKVASGAQKEAVKDAIAGAALRRFGVDVGKTATLEGLTESAQEATSIFAEKFVLENQDVFSEENIDRMINAFGGGFFGGATYGSIAKAGESLFMKSGTPLKPEEIQTDLESQLEEITTIPEGITLATDQQSEPVVLNPEPELLPQINAEQEQYQGQIQKSLEAIRASAQQLSPEASRPERNVVADVARPKVNRARKGKAAPASTAPAVDSTQSIMPEQETAPKIAEASSTAKTTPNTLFAAPKGQKRPAAKKADTPNIALPSNLAGATPKYKQSTLKFENDIDKAAYIAGSKSAASKADPQYVDFLKANGVQQKDIPALAQKVRNKLKSLPPAEDGTITVPSTYTPSNGKLVQEQRAIRSEPVNPAVAEDSAEWADIAEDFAGSVLKSKPVKDPARFDKTTTKIAEEIRKVAGPDVRVEFVEDLGIMKDGFGNQVSPLLGAQYDNVVYVALNRMSSDVDPMDTAMHEVGHFLYNHALTDAQLEIVETERSRLIENVLKRQNALTGFPSDQAFQQDLEMMPTQEIFATAFGQYASDRITNRNPGNYGLAQKVLNTAFKILKTIKKAFSRQGIKKYEDLFESMLEGEIRPYTEFSAVNHRIQTQEAVEMYKLAAGERKMFDTSLKTAPKAFEGRVKTALNENQEYLASTKAGAMARITQFFTSLNAVAHGDRFFATVHNFLAKEYFPELHKMQEYMQRIAKPVMEDRKLFTEGATLLKEMYLSDQKLTIDPTDGRLVFKRGDKTFKASAAVTNKIKEIKGLTDTVLKGHKDVMVESLKEMGLTDTSKAGVQAELDAVTAKIDEFISKYDEQGLDVAGIDGPAYTSLLEKQQSFTRVIEFYNMAEKALRPDALYFPQMRFGEYGVSVKDKTTNELVAFYAVEANPVLGGVNKWSRKDTYDRIKAEGYADSSKYKVSADPFLMTKNNLQREMGPNAEYTMELMIGALASNAKSSVMSDLTDMAQGVDMSGIKVPPNLNLQELEKFKSELSSGLMARGFAKHFMESKRLPGASPDVERSLAAYLTGVPYYLNSARYAPHMAKLKRLVNEANINNVYKEKLLSDLDYVLAPQADQDHLRMFSFMYTMGLNPSTAALQVLTNVTMTPAYISQWKNPLAAQVIAFKNLGKAGAIMAAAKGDLSRLGDDNFLKQFFPDEIMRRQMKTLFQNKYFNPGTANDYLGPMRSVDQTSKGQTRRYAQMAGEIMGKPIQFAEETSRIASAMSLLESIKTKEDMDRIKVVMKNDQSFQDALQASPFKDDFALMMAAQALVEVHAQFGKEGRGFNQRGIAGSLLMPFMTHPMQTMELMYRMAFERGAAGRIAIAHAFTTFFILGGLMALPGMEFGEDLFNRFYKMFTGREIDGMQALNRAIAGADLLSPRVSEAVTDGGALKAAFGIDVARRIGTPFWFQGLVSPMIEGKTDAGQFLGVPGSLLLRDIPNASAAYGRGDIGLMDAGIAAFAPVALKNMWQATMIYPNIGIRNTMGTQLVAPEEVGVSDIIKKGLGFGPASVARQRAEQNYLRISQTGHQNKKSQLIEKVVNKQLEIDKARKEGAQPEDLEAMREEKKNLLHEVYKFSHQVGERVDSAYRKNLSRTLDNRLQKKRDPSAVIKEMKILRDTGAYQISKKVYDLEED